MAGERRQQHVQQLHANVSATESAGDASAATLNYESFLKLLVAR